MMAEGLNCRGMGMRDCGTALLTDFYQLTMAHAYFERSRNGTAVFELFVRRLPGSRRFLVAAGLEQALAYLETLRFTAEDIGYLEGLGSFSTAFLEFLSGLRFTGQVEAMPEGTIFFAEEPILRITAPLIQAQLVESRLINILHFQTMIASKAVRCVLAAQGRRLIDFGMRRAHEASAAVHAARAAYLAGFQATATVEAGHRFGIPVSGTMAHSFIEAHDREEDAFRDFVTSRPAGAIVLIDTYDTGRAARRVADLLRESKLAVEAVRIDSGDLAAEARKVRTILDSNGCQHVKIVLSGGLDETIIAQLVEAGVPVDAFGVGTSLDVSADAPSLDMAYKLQEYAGKPRRKWSPGKVTWPGAKQVFRERDPSGRRFIDRIVLTTEAASGHPLLNPVMSDGKRCAQVSSLAQIRARFAQELELLPAPLRELSGGDGGAVVEISDKVRALAAQADGDIR